MSILNMYYDLCDLSKQRQWIAKHVTPVPVAKAGSGPEEQDLKVHLTNGGWHTCCCLQGNHIIHFVIPQYRNINGSECDVPRYRGHQ